MGPPNLVRRLASRSTQSDTQRLCQTTQLEGCSTCAAFQPIYRNDIAPELGESKQVQDVLRTRQTCAQCRHVEEGPGRGSVAQGFNCSGESFQVGDIELRLVLADIFHKRGC